MRPSRAFKCCAFACVASLAFAPTAGVSQILSSGDTIAAQPASAPARPVPTLPSQAAPQSPAPTKPPRKPRTEAAAKTAKAVGCLAGAVVLGALFRGLAVQADASRAEVNQATAAGVALGCAAGFQIGKNWSERDKAAYGDASQDVLDDPTPQSRDWYAPESGDRVTLITTAATTESREVDFQYYNNIAAPVAGSRVISRPYRATNLLRLRSTPDENNPNNIVGRFEKDEIVEVVGLTPDGRWGMIGESGVIVGYASMDYLMTLEASRTLRRTVVARAKPDRPASAPASRPTKGKAAPAPAAPAAPRQVQTTRLVASTQCKSLVATSGTQRDKKKGCSLPSGKWAFA